MNNTPLRVAPRPRLLRFVTDNLQVKILLLVLMPLILSSSCLLLLEGYERIQTNREQIAQQRQLLLESRQRGVRGHVELAKSMVETIAATVPDTETAQRRALELLESLRFEGDNYVFVYQSDGVMLVQPAAPDKVGTNMLDATDANGKHMIRDMAELAAQGGGVYQYEWPHPNTGEPEAKHSYATAVEPWDWVIGAGVYVTDIDAAMADIEAAATNRLVASLVRLWGVGTVANLIIAAFAMWLARRTVKQVRYTATTIKEIASEVAAGKGDLTRRLTVRSHDEIGKLGEQFNAFLSRMQSMLRDVRHSANAVNRAANDIAQGSEELATRTDQAAANLQQTSSAMEEITSTVENNAEHTEHADRLVKSTADVAQQGQVAMQGVEKTMDDISRSSSQIGDIVSMIDSIAFQTNILALNASVEAARAGEHGRGFAVVAQEVRKLAQRSAEAAREIKGLIESSAKLSQDGTQIVQRAGETMREIFESVGQVTAVISEISAGSREQSVGIGEVNTAVNQLDTMTQQNAAMVEQSSTTAAQMRRQAEQLSALIDSFVLGDEEGRSASRATPASLATPGLPAPAPAKVAPPVDPKPTPRAREPQPAAAEGEPEWETF
ncbi:HAMP domain-containing protein [Billgrantia azerbaijanica]|nr:HAMP domain-containing protein [Halomonas azerbaijanica]